MTASLTVAVLGITVRLEVPEHLAAELDRAGDALRATHPADPARTIRLAPGPGGDLDLWDGSELVLVGVAPDRAVAAVLWRLNAVVAAATTHLVVHAACVARRGRALVLPGPSGAGKSHLSAACVRAGLAYLSDEHAAVDLATGLLAPVPRPMDLGPLGLRTASELRAGTGRAGEPVPAEPSTPVALLFPRFRTDAPGQVTPLAPADALLALWANVTNAAVLGEAGFRMAAGLAARCPAWQLTYCRDEDARAEVERLLDETASAHPAAPARPGPEWLTGGAGTAAVALGEDLVIRHERSGAVHRLNAGAAAIWLSAGALPPLPIDGLAARVASALPGRGAPAAVIRATLEELGRLGLLAEPAEPARGHLADR